MGRAILRLRKTTGAMLLLLALAGCAIAPPLSPTPPLAPTPDWTPTRLVAHTTQAGDMISSNFGTDDFKISIESEKGIGKATFERPGAAPKSVTFYLRLKGLEEFRLTWGDVTVTAHYPSSGGPVREDASRAGGQATAIDESSPYWAAVRIQSDNPVIPLQDGYFVITAPPAFIQDAPDQFAAQWIDFYR